MRQLGDIGQQTAYEDGLVRGILTDVKEKEQKLISEYNNLKNFKTNNYQEFTPHINAELARREVFLKKRKKLLKDQRRALLKLLDHLLTVDSKKQFCTEKLLNEINRIEDELIPYNKI